MEKFNGVVLLDKILEFVAMTPDEMGWNYKALSSNKPRLIRLKRISSLLSAFSLTANKNLFEKTTGYLNPDFKAEIKSVLKGDFIKDRDRDVYHELNDFVKRYFQERNGSTRDMSINKGILSFVYPKMINYKIKLREIIDFNSGVMEASIPFARFYVELTNSISSNLVNKYDDLDYALELIINPGKLVFTERELIEKFNYPTDDLHQIDMDYY